MYDDNCGLPRLRGDWCGIVTLDSGVLSGCWLEVGQMVELLDISSAFEAERLTCGNSRADVRVVVHKFGCRSTEWR